LTGGRVSAHNPPMKFGASLFAYLLPLATLAANWPQYRGPQASGVDASKPVPIRWNVETGENVLWQTPIPGLGHAAPIVWDDRVYVATAVSGAKADLKVGLYGDIASADDNGPQQWRLLALDRATGKVAWNILGKEAAPKVKRHTKASHCNSTPVTDGERIIAIFGSEGLFCFDLAGKPTWQKDLGPMDSGYFDVPSAQWGFASSPVIHEGKVIVQCDVQKDSFLAVFDVKDGRRDARPETDRGQRLAPHRRLRLRDRQGAVEARRRRGHSGAHAHLRARADLPDQCPRQIPPDARDPARRHGQHHPWQSGRNQRENRLGPSAAGQLHADTHCGRGLRVRLRGHRCARLLRRQDGRDPIQ
jgi:hypothetical protein